MLEQGGGTQGMRLRELGQPGPGLKIENSCAPVELELIYGDKSH